MLHPTEEGIQTVDLQGGERLAESEERFPAEAHETDGGGEARWQNQRGKILILWTWIFNTIWLSYI